MCFRFGAFQLTALDRVPHAAVDTIAPAKAAWRAGRRSGERGPSSAGGAGDVDRVLGRAAGARRLAPPGLVKSGSSARRGDGRVARWNKRGPRLVVQPARDPRGSGLGREARGGSKEAFGPGRCHRPAPTPFSGLPGRGRVHRSDPAHALLRATPTSGRRRCTMPAPRPAKDIAFGRAHRMRLILGQGGSAARRTAAGGERTRVNPGRGTRVACFVATPRPSTHRVSARDASPATPTPAGTRALRCFAPCQACLLDQPRTRSLAG
jgi:hypothetical protein